MEMRLDREIIAVASLVGQSPDSAAAAKDSAVATFVPSPMSVVDEGGREFKVTVEK